MVVLTKFNIDKSADQFLTLNGRQAGFISFLLNIVGIGPTVELQCNRSMVLYKKASIKGSVTSGTPNTAITTVKTGNIKPLPYLIIAILLVVWGVVGFVAMAGHSLGGAFGNLIVSACIGIAFFYAYKHNYKTMFAIYAGGNHDIAYLAIKKSVMGGVNVTLEQLEEGASLLREVVINARGHHPKEDNLEASRQMPQMPQMLKEKEVAY